MESKYRRKYLILGVIFCGAIFLLFLFLFLFRNLSFLEACYKASIATLIVLIIPAVAILFSLMPFIIFKRPIRSLKGFYKTVCYAPLVALLFSIGWYIFQSNKRFGADVYFSKISKQQAALIMDSLDCLENFESYKVILTRHEDLDSLERQDLIYSKKGRIKIFSVLLRDESLYCVAEHEFLENSSYYDETYELVKHLQLAKKVMDSLGD